MRRLAAVAVPLVLVAGCGGAASKAAVQPVVSTSPSPAAAVLLSASGTQGGSTGMFTATGPWSLSYSADCSKLRAMGVSRTFSAMVRDANGGADLSIPELGPADNGTFRVSKPGSFFVTVFVPDCSWSVTVRAQ